MYYTKMCKYWHNVREKLFAKGITTALSEDRGVGIMRESKEAHICSGKGEGANVQRLKVRSINISPKFQEKRITRTIWTNRYGGREGAHTEQYICRDKDILKSKI